MKKTALAKWLELPGAPQQRDLARSVSISEAYLSQIVAGKREPSLSVAKRISEATHGFVPATSMVVSKKIATSEAAE